jgi:hypothetical protein
MSRATLWIFSLFLLSLPGCALFEERRGPNSFFGPREQVYYASFDEVWGALNRSLQLYPLRVSNQDQGIVETDVIRGNRVWTPPHKPERSSNSGEQYRLIVRVIKGNLERRAATKVTVVKETQVQQDFFSDPRAVASDGLEEKALLYRVAREVQIERALNRAQKRINEKSLEQSN